jgi:SAM-dependent methyltransferase
MDQALTNKDRWQSAQIAERMYWQGYRTSRAKLKPLIDEYWSYYLRILKNYLKPQDRVLDIGCGPDGVINYIDNEQKYGLDPLMDFYLSNFEMPKNINWKKGVGENIPFETDFFDFVITTNTLDHTKEPQKMLKEISRVLKRGCFLFLTVNCYGPLSMLYKRAKEIVGKRVDPLHPHSLPFWQVEKLLMGSKFDVRVVRSGIVDMGKYAGKKPSLRKEKRVSPLRALCKTDKIFGYDATGFLFIAVNNREE